MPGETGRAAAQAQAGEEGEEMRGSVELCGMTALCTLVLCVCVVCVCVCVCVSIGTILYIMGYVSLSFFSLPLGQAVSAVTGHRTCTQAAPHYRHAHQPISQHGRKCPPGAKIPH